MLPREDLFAAPHHPKAVPQACRAVPVLRSGGCSRARFQTKGRARPPSRARCARALVPSAPSNKRLKLTGPALNGIIGLFHAVLTVRGRGSCAHRRSPRSLSAIR